MSTKLSFVARGAAVAGILALALPAFAQTRSPAAMGAAAAAAAVATEKQDHKQASGETKAEKGKTHAAKKHVTKTAKNSSHHKQTQAPADHKTDASNPAKPATPAPSTSGDAAH